MGKILPVHYFQLYFYILGLISLKSALIIVFFFCWTMLAESFTFELSSLASLKDEKKKTEITGNKEHSVKHQSMVFLALMFKSSIMY